MKINLGAGPDGIAGWVNYDWGWLALLGKLTSVRKMLVFLGLLPKSYDRRWPATRLHDLRKGIPLKNKSVYWIYCSNFLEHLEKYEARELLLECLRVLEPGGRIRLVVPDLLKVVNNYLKSRKADIFCKEFYGFDKDLQLGFGSKLIRGHQWMYDITSLKGMMLEVGFVKIVISKHRQSMMPDVKQLDLEVHKELGLYIEAEKS